MEAAILMQQIKLASYGKENRVAPCQVNRQSVAPNLYGTDGAKTIVFNRPPGLEVLTTVVGEQRTIFMDTKMEKDFYVPYLLVCYRIFYIG
jgi:hypothetical protein